MKDLKKQIIKRSNEILNLRMKLASLDKQQARLINMRIDLLEQLAIAEKDQTNMLVNLK